MLAHLFVLCLPLTPGMYSPEERPVVVMLFVLTLIIIMPIILISVQ